MIIHLFRVEPTDRRTVTTTKEREREKNKQVIDNFLLLNKSTITGTPVSRDAFFLFLPLLKGAKTGRQTDDFLIGHFLARPTIEFGSVEGEMVVVVD